MGGGGGVINKRILIETISFRVHDDESQHIQPPFHMPMKNTKYIAWLNWSLQWCNICQRHFIITRRYQIYAVHTVYKEYSNNAINKYTSLVCSWFSWPSIHWKFSWRLFHFISFSLLPYRARCWPSSIERSTGL